MKKLITSSILALATVGFVGAAFAEAPVSAEKHGSYLWTSKKQVRKSARALKDNADILIQTVEYEKGLKQLVMPATRVKKQAREMLKAVNSGAPYWKIRMHSLRANSAFNRLNRRVQSKLEDIKKPSKKQMLRQAFRPVRRATLRTNYNVSPIPIGLAAGDVAQAVTALRTEAESGNGMTESAGNAEVAFYMADSLCSLVDGGATFKEVRQEFTSLKDQLEVTKESLEAESGNLHSIRPEWRKLRRSFNKLTRRLTLKKGELGGLSGGGNGGGGHWGGGWN